MKKNVIKLGLLGLGTVGSGVVRTIEENCEEICRRIGAEIEIERILVRDPDKNRRLSVDKSILTDSFSEIAENEEIDIVVELIGGREPALEYILKSLKNGKHVVTANKEVMACSGREVLEAARKYGRGISFEGSVAAGIPIINTLKKALIANRIKKITGIINGTTNYILTAMEEEGKDFQKALEEAQNKGFAESEPDSDIEGWDAAYKLAILASIAFECRITLEDVFREGIGSIESQDIEYAEKLGYRIKLVAAAEEKDAGIEVRVHPAFLPLEHPLASVKGVFNAVLVRGNAVGEVLISGAGAGEMPTASAVVADIMNIAEGILNSYPGGTPCTCTVKKRIIQPADYRGKYYLRLKVFDQPGMVAKISKVFGDNQISLASILQMEEETEIVDVVFITHGTREANLRRTVEELTNINGVRAVKNVIRVEEKR